MHNALLIEKANNEKQAALREKREILIADIEKEQVRLSEFDECGDYDSIKNYVADCTALSKRLQQYATTIEAINREESLFKESDFLFLEQRFFIIQSLSSVESLNSQLYPDLFRRYYIFENNLQSEV